MHNRVCEARKSKNNVFGHICIKRVQFLSDCGCSIYFKRVVYNSNNNCTGCGHVRSRSRQNEIFPQTHPRNVQITKLSRSVGIFLSFSVSVSLLVFFLRKNNLTRLERLRHIIERLKIFNPRVYAERGGLQFRFQPLLSCSTFAGKSN